MDTQGYNRQDVVWGGVETKRNLAFVVIVNDFQLKTFANMPIIMFEITYFISYSLKGGI